MNANRSEAQSAATNYQAMMAELNRRFATQARAYHLCPNRLCRRLRRCAGADMPCVGHAGAQPISGKDGRRVKRGIKQTRTRR